MSDAYQFNHNSMPRIMRSLRAFALLLLLCAMLLAGPSRSQGQERFETDLDDEPEETALYQALLDLTTPWTVMCVAAHPDDEDGATLTVLRRKGGVHTVTLFSTYGEGGQNAIGPELYEELGAIRARETAEAARVQGSEPYFLGLRDFGFSKTADEALLVWGHDVALARMVLQIRRLRPDVIITNHDTVTGHGHHQATGRLVIEAFDAAADPARFPEQLRDGLTVWQPQRLFVRFGFEGTPATRAVEDEALREGRVVSISQSERDPVRGLTYAEQALRALRRHASQGPWPSTVPAVWTRPIRYRLARTARSSAPLPSNAPSLLSGLTLPKGVADKLMPLAARAMLPVYLANGSKAEGVLDALVAARKAGLFAPSGEADDLPRFRLMSDRLDRALALASGIRVVVAPGEDVLVRETATPVSLSITNRGARAAQITEIDFKDLRYEGGIDVPRELSPGATLNLTADALAPREAATSVPHAAHLYDGLLFGVEVGARVYMELDGARFPVSAKTRMDIAPAVEIVGLSPSFVVLTPATAGHEITFNLKLVNHQRIPFGGVLKLAGVAGGESKLNVSLQPKEARNSFITFKVRSVDALNQRPIPTPDIESLQLTLYQDGSPNSLAQQKVRVIYSDARVADGLRVGFVPSYDDTLRNALAALGVEGRELTVKDVQAGRLRRYDAIIIDNRG
ncbi:MAG TPA: PIG-L family deacetylase, partial [Pyrinomonadaceae bacterium]|nr:PIG-L family deacetylase [Pyrinomonadaceae bacterium]